MSDETPWTPGPWEVINSDPDKISVAYIPREQMPVADIAGFKPIPEREANARLIAAAPRMAKLLERLQRVGDREHDQLSRLSQEAVDEINTLLTEIKGDE